MIHQTSLHSDLIQALKLVYEPNGFFVKNIVQEAESKAYAACSFEINHKKIQFRVAKITPTKKGLFVTLWKRMTNGPIMPFDITDSIDFFIVSVRKHDYFGQFIFPKNVLLEKGIVSHNGKGGKRALRVYQPWEATDNAQARKTQAWQCKYYFEIQLGINAAQLKNLLQENNYNTHNL